MEVILRALCRPHGSASWAEALTGVSAEAPPGLEFYSVPESPRPVGQHSECGRWTARGGGRRNNLRERDGVSHLQTCPPPLCRKAGEHCFGGMERKKVLIFKTRPEWGRGWGRV